MKIGVNTWVWTSPFTTNDFHLIPKVKEMGFDVLRGPRSKMRRSSTSICCAK